MRRSKEEIEQDESKNPQHVPILQYDGEREKQKEDNRKKLEKLRKSSKKNDTFIVTENGEVKNVNALTLFEQEQEIIKCATDPIYFIETYLTIFDQTKGDSGELVPFNLFDFQKVLVNDYQEHRFNVVNKYRQAGISTTTCAYISWYVSFNSNRSVAIVADKLETARDELMNDVVDFIETCPKWLTPNTGKDTERNLKDTQKLKRYDNGSQLGAFSSKGLRGYTPTLIFWDETAWTEKSDKFWTSAQPTLQTGGAAIMVSTPSGLDPVFYKTFIGARKKENQFNAVELWWFNDARYNEHLNWYKNKGKKNEIKIKDENWSKEHRIKLMDDKWEASSPWFEEQISNANGDMRKINQELLCSFLGSGDNFIAEEYLNRIEENEIKPPIRQEYVDLNMWIWEDPIEGEDYIMAIDVSPGHGEDSSTVNILKTSEVIEEKVIKEKGKTKKKKIKKYIVEQVAEYYGKITPQQLAEVGYQFGKIYNDAYAVIDITGGHGIHSAEKLIEFGYENIHYAEVTHKPSRDRLSGYIKKGQKTMPDGSLIDVDLIPGFFIGNNRPSVLLEMQRAIHLKDIVIRSVRLLGELKTFITVSGNRIADHKRSFHDDSIMGISIGLYVLNFDMAKFNRSKISTEKLLNAMLSANDVKKHERKNKTKPLVSSINSPELNMHLTNSWLFAGLGKKKR